MPYHQDKYNSIFLPQDLYKIVADIEKYPEFLPWVSAVRIIEQSKDELIADVMVSFAALSQKYRCKILLSPPKGKNGNAKIDVEYIEGPFKHLTTKWRFEKVKEGTEIFFELDFEFKSKLLETMIGTIFEKAVGKMTAAFIERANEAIGK
jgi:coenzyme Q-binding protein COQ10